MTPEMETEFYRTIGGASTLSNAKAIIDYIKFLESRIDSLENPPKMTDFIKSGYRVIGPNTADGSLHSWYFASEKDANRFAEHLASKVYAEIEVCKFVSIFRSKKTIEHIKAKD